MLRLIALGACGLVATACGSGDGAAKRPGASHRVEVTYADATNDIERAIRTGGVAESVAQQVTAKIKLPENLTIAMGAGSNAPQFTYDERTITVPWSFVNLVYRQLAETGYEGKRLEAGVEEVVAFVLSHEMAHALIDTLDLPITGREEDAADDFAAIIALGYEQQVDIVGATADFLRSVSRTEQIEEADYLDEHSLSIQRFASINCLRYGSDPVAHAEIAVQLRLSSARRDGCVAQWTNTVRSWYRLLAPHTRSGALAPK